MQPIYHDGCPHKTCIQNIYAKHFLELLNSINNLSEHHLSKTIWWGSSLPISAHHRLGSKGGVVNAFWDALFFGLFLRQHQFGFGKELIFFWCEEAKLLMLCAIFNVHGGKCNNQFILYPLGLQRMEVSWKFSLRYHSVILI